MVLLATSSKEDARDILQDSMFTLASRYGDKSPEQWSPLFYRILQNKLRDWYRRQAIRKRIFFWQSESQHPRPANDAGSENQDVIERAESDTIRAPDDRLYQQQLSAAIEQALTVLPLKQQQCFLLRAWQGLSVKQTADAMDISEGSVKTHYSRAIQALRNNLGDFNFQMDRSGGMYE